MVVARPALHQTSAGGDFTNTKVCCTLRGVEYAGYGMDHPASDRSDRRLRPRATCPRCKQLESLCACKKQAQRSTTASTTRSRAAQVTSHLPEVVKEKSKVLATRGRATYSSLQPAYQGEATSSSSAELSTSSGEVKELILPGPSQLDTDSTPPSVGVGVVRAGGAEPLPPPLQLRAVPPTGVVQTVKLIFPSAMQSSAYSPTTKFELQPRSSSPPKSSFGTLKLETIEQTSSESFEFTSSDTTSPSGSSGMQQDDPLLDQPSTSQPSTSQYMPICDTPKRTNLNPLPRRLFSSSPTKRSMKAVQTKSKSVAQSKAIRVAKTSRKPPAEVFKGPYKDRSSVSDLGEGSSGARTTTKGSKVQKTASNRSRSHKSSLRGSSKIHAGVKSVSGSSKAPQNIPEPPSIPGTSREGIGAKKGRTQSSQKGHMCPECGKAFGSPGKLSQHMFSHTGERPFPCTQCSKAFSSKFKLVRHNLIHSTVRRFVCGTCGRQFHRKDHLQNHAKIHAAVKLKFRCDRDGCNKEYTSANSARKHSAAHAAQDGQLDCTLCGRHFGTTPEVLHHLKVHAGSRAVKTQADRKFTCEVCERSFFTRKDVRRHLVVHTGLRDFLCQFCPQRFGRKDHLVRHIKKSHQTGRTKSRRKSRRVVPDPDSSMSRDPLSSPGPSGTRDPSPLTSGDVTKPKEEPSEFSFVEVKEEDIQPQELQNIVTLELAQTLPLYPPPPYPKPTGIVPPYPAPPEDVAPPYPMPPEDVAPPYPLPPEDIAPPDDLTQSYPKPTEDLSQFYSIVPDIQRLFTTESGNGQLLMSLMESVELSATSQGSEMLPSTSQVMSPALELSSAARELMMSSSSRENPALVLPIVPIPLRLSSDTRPSSLDLGLCESSLAEQLMASTNPESSSGLGDNRASSVDLGLCEPSLAERLMASATPESPSGPGNGRESGSSLDLGLCEPSMAERLMASPGPVSPSTSRAVMETLLREEGDKNSAPLPRFDQAFPPQ